MRTTAPLAITLALFLSAAFFAGSGFNDAVRGDRGMSELRDNVDGAANASGTDELAADRGSDESSIVGLIIGTGGTAKEIIALTLLLPITLQNLGFPLWFAAPVGGVLEILVIVGVIQFLTGRSIR